tara:strand:+ start:511 stop:867 length:357 start_codon:yes stop_codon:yes gene_type:complete
MTLLKRHNRDAQNQSVATMGNVEPLSPLGRPMRLEDLPPVTTKRWVARRKAEVVSAVRGGLISLQDACRRYSLSEDEYRSWEQLIDDHGLKGLHTTRTQVYRNIAQRKGRGPNLVTSH